MDLQLLIHKLIEKDLRRCERLHGKLIKLLKTLPRGSLSNRGGEVCRFVRENGKQYLIPIRKDKKMLRELKLRRLSKKGIPVLQSRIRLLSDFLKKDVLYDPQGIVANLPCQYQGLADVDVFLEGDVNYEKWISEKTRINPMPFREIHYTSQGQKCRSKSEALIGTCLETRGMPYRLESELKCDGKTYYPDFEIFHEKIRRIVYLEHFGMIDNPDYAEKCFRKLDDYRKCGLYLGVNFFFTYETGKKPLTVKEIEVILDEIEVLRR